MRRTLTILVVAAMAAVGAQLAGAADEDIFDTKAASAHLEKGIVHLKDKKYDTAISELEEAVSINPDAEAYYYLGYAYYMKGRKGDEESRKKSIDCFDKAYELNPAFTPSKFKPSEAPAAQPAEKKTGSEAPAALQNPEQPSSPDQPAAEQPNQQTSEPASPQQPAAPKMTDKVKNIGNIPAVP